MNKNKIIIAVVVLLLILGAGGFFLMNRKQKGSPSPTTQNQANQTPVATKSLKDLLALGVAQSCTYTSSANDITSKGTVYISGGKYRGDFTTTTADGKSTQSHLISADNTSYIWMEGQITGFKTTLSTENNPTPGAEAQTGNLDVNANLDYNCSPWVVNTALFTPPTTVKFMDFSAPTGSGIPSVPQVQIPSGY